MPDRAQTCSRARTAASRQMRFFYEAEAPFTYLDGTSKKTSISQS